jgi:hypothetical protein
VHVSSSSSYMIIKGKDRESKNSSASIRRPPSERDVGVGKVEKKTHPHHQGDTVKRTYHTYAKDTHEETYPRVSR